ncbi:MAG: glycosyltransferase family 39 protein [Armatimonadetes bacterium]|nr:glycosyltransferase family 39 protein [Armatimonadota bacterium]
MSILVILSGAGIGGLVRAPMRRGDESLDERILLDIAFGLGVLSLIVFVFGSLRLFWWKWLPYVLLLPALGFFWRGLPDIAFAARGFATRKRTAFDLLCAFILVAVAVMVLIPAIAPPSMSDWDSLAYHLAVPKLWIKHGGFYYIEFASHSNFPSLTEMLYIPGLILCRPDAAKLIHYWIGVLLAMAVAILTRKHFDSKTQDLSRAFPKVGNAWMASIALAGMPIVLWEATTAYIDLATAFYTVVAVHLLLEYVDKMERRHLLGCAACAGFAASTKMTGLALIPMLAIWLLVYRWTAEKKVYWKPTLALVLVAFATCLPWYVKTYLYTGNPVYPFFYSIFGGRDWSAELARNYSTLQSRFGLGHGPAAFLTLPYDLAIRPDAFYDTPGLFVGPIFLVAVPILMVARYRTRKLVGLALLFAAHVVAWFVLTQQSRYLIPAFSLLAVLVSGLLSADESFRRTRAAVWIVLFATAIFGLWTLVSFVKAAAPCVFGFEAHDDYLRKTLDIYPAQEFVNNNVPIDAKLALFGDTRGFYLDRSYVWADPGHNARFTRYFGSLGEFISYLRKAGITHAMVNFRFFPTRTRAGAQARLVYDAIESGRFQLIYQTRGRGGVVAVYELR